MECPDTACSSYALTTTFRPPSYCSSSWVNDYPERASLGVLLFTRNATDAACQPTQTARPDCIGCPMVQSRVYSPGVCPEHMPLATSDTGPMVDANGVTTQFCCPREANSIITGYESGTRLPLCSSFRVPPQPELSSIIYDKTFGGSTERTTEVVTLTEALYAAKPIMIAYRAGDFFQSDASVGVPTTGPVTGANSAATGTPMTADTTIPFATNTSPANSPEASHGLSLGAKIGISVGASLGTLNLLAFGFWIFWVRKRKHSGELDEAGKPELPAGDENWVAGKAGHGMNKRRASELDGLDTVTSELDGSHGSPVELPTSTHWAASGPFEMDADSKEGDTATEHSRRNS